MLMLSCSMTFFFYLSFYLLTFTIYRTVGKAKDISLAPLYHRAVTVENSPPAAGLKSGTFGFRAQVADHASH